MENKDLYAAAIELCQIVIANCKNEEESKHLLVLLSKLVEIRWAIPQQQS